MKLLLENWRGYLTEQRVSYSGVVLDEESQQKLLELGVPEGWTPVAHHMTITMGPLSKRDETNGGLYKVGDQIELKVVGVGQDERAKAVKIEPPRPANMKHVKYPHVTVAVNAAAGGKPQHSKKLQQFEPINLVIRGTVEEVAG
jgi:hypothetical protein